MDNREYYILLFDIYEELLTTKQRQYFKDYYFDDLSIGEIAGNYDVSRNAVFDQIKKVCNLLIAYEEKLNIFKTHEKLSEVLELTDLIEIKKIIKTIIKE